MIQPIEITLLSQPCCAACGDAKQVLAKLAAEFPLRVREVDLTTQEGQLLAHEVRLLFAPGVLVDGELFSHGRLSERKLRRVLIGRQSQLA